MEGDSDLTFDGSDLTTTGTVTWSGGGSANANTAYSHSQDNTQAHSDYLLNSGNDATSGTLTATGFIIGGSSVNEAELGIIDGATLTTTELNFVDGVTSDIQTQLDAKVDDNTAWMITDTIVLGAFSAIDSFNTSFIYGSFYQNGSDTLVVTEMGVSCLGTTVSFTVDIEWHATLGSGSATGLNTTPPTITDESGAITSDVSFDASEIPPGVQVWLKTPTVTTAPTYLSVTLLGYRKNQSY